MLPVVHSDAVPVHDRPAGRHTPVVSLPQEVLHVHARLPASLVDVTHCEYLGPVSIPVNVQPRLEGVLVHQADVPLVQYGVLRLNIEKFSIKRNNYEILCFV